MSEEVETLGEAPPLLNDLLPRTVKSFMQFSYSVTPRPPRVSGSIPGLAAILSHTKNDVSLFCALHWSLATWHAVCDNL